MALARIVRAHRIDPVPRERGATTPVAHVADPDRVTRMLAGMFRDTRDHVALKDLDGRYVYVNRACAEWFGLPIEAIIGRTNAQLWSDTDANAILQHDRDLLEFGRPIEYEEELTREGVTRTWLTTKDVVRNDAGIVTGFGAISREITSRVVAEQALARSDEALHQSLRLLNGILERTTDHISVRDTAGRFLLANRSCATWYGSTPEAMLGRTCAELFTHDEAAVVAQRDLLMLEMGRPMNYEETHVADGVSHIWLTTRDVLRDEGGQIVAHFAISREITELRQAEAQSHQSQKMESIGRLAGGIAHDFNNLLTVISGNAQFLLLDLEDHPGRAAAEDIATAADRAASVTRQLLAFSRQQVLAPEILDVQSVVTEIDPLIRRLVGEHVEIETHVESLPGLVRVDRSQLGQVLLNLVINARDAMPDGGRLTITMTNVELGDADALVHAGITPGPYVELAVTDTGVGIDPAARERIFEPFYTTKGPGKGTGLGLAMVEGVVRQSGGDIWVESEPGVGTTFRVHLPRLDRTPAVRQPKADPGPEPGGRETILLVEDEPAVRQIVRRILGAAGYDVLEAAGPAAASVVIDERSADIDLLLTDVVMPGGTGPDVARMLRSSKSEAGVLYMSGYTDDAISHQGVLEPGVTLLTKPFSSQGLLEAVRAKLAPATPGAGSIIG